MERRSLNSVCFFNGWMVISYTFTDSSRLMTAIRLGISGDGMILRIVLSICSVTLIIVAESGGRSTLEEEVSLSVVVVVGLMMDWIRGILLSLLWRALI